MVARLMPSDPRYPRVALLMHYLATHENAACHYDLAGVDPLVYRADWPALKRELLGELEAILRTGRNE